MYDLSIVSFLRVRSMDPIRVFRSSGSSWKFELFYLPVVVKRISCIERLEIKLFKT